MRSIDCSLAAAAAGYLVLSGADHYDLSVVTPHDLSVVIHSL